MKKTAVTPALTPGDIIRERRKERGVALGQMAQQLNCSDSHLSDIEHNKRRPTEKMINKIARGLKLDYDYTCLLFGRVPSSIRTALVRGDFTPLHELEQRWIRENAA